MHPMKLGNGKIKATVTVKGFRSPDPGVPGLVVYLQENMPVKCIPPSYPTFI